MNINFPKLISFCFVRCIKNTVRNVTENMQNREKVNVRQKVKNFEKC